jgi:hypothetical protein
MWHVGWAAVFAFFASWAALAGSWWPPPGPAANVVPLTIKSDCSADVTQSLQNWINSVPDNSTLVFGRDACYRVDRTLVVQNRVGLTLRGNGATFRRVTPSPPELQYPNANAHWTFVGDSNLTVRDMKVVGLNTSPDPNDPVPPGTPEPGKFGARDDRVAFEYAYGVFASQNVTFVHLSADAAYGDGLLIGGEHQPDLVQNFKAFDVTIDRNGRQGVAIVTAHGVVLDKIYIQHSRRSGIDIEANGGDGFPQDIEIRNSDIVAASVPISDAGVDTTTNVYIHDNIIRWGNPSHSWITTGATSPHHNKWRIVHNQALFDMGEYPAMSLDYVDNLEIRDNVATETAPPAARAGERLVAVTVSNSGAPVTITGNDFSGFNVVYQGSSGVVVQACGNRLTVGGAFNQPKPC